MIRIAIQFILLVLIQSLIFNNLIIGGCAMACVFIYSIIALPVTLNDNLRLTIGFLLGLLVDIFANTQGLNALCCTVAVALHAPSSICTSTARKTLPERRRHRAVWDTRRFSNMPSLWC